MSRSPHPSGADSSRRDVIIVGGGLAGLSAAVYLARSRRDTVLIESGHSMAVWEPDVQNYLGFPEGISGEALLGRGRAQVERFGITIVRDEVRTVCRLADEFRVEGRGASYRAKRVLLATGLTHLPPDIPGVRECLGKSLFFCKDCDAFRVQDKRIVIVGWNNEAAEYALAMLAFSPSVLVALNGREPHWDDRHDGWLREYGVPVRRERVTVVDHAEGCLRALRFEHGESIQADAVFTTRGDVYHTALAEGAGASLDEEGQVVVDHHMRTSVPGLYAAGCMTPANCQMIIAAGQGATAAQAINRDLFEESLRQHALPVYEQSVESVNSVGSVWTVRSVGDSNGLNGLNRLN
ncbi:NAD(P)/FAD-dependent oxidoreductase [Candidatus Nitrospira bockiana]